MPPRADPRPEPDRGWRRRAARRFLIPLALAVAGIVVILATSGTGNIIGGGILAIAATIAISLVFLEIGLSEDRDRERHPQG